MYESVYRQAQATFPTLVVNKVSHVCTFCLSGLKLKQFLSDAETNSSTVLNMGLLQLGFKLSL